MEIYVALRPRVFLHRCPSIAACLRKNGFSSATKPLSSPSATSEAESMTPVLELRSPTRRTHGEANRRQIWSAEELAKLQSLRESGVGWHRIKVEMPHRSMKALYTMANRLRIATGERRPLRFWTAEEDNKLRELKDAHYDWSHIRAEFPERSMRSLTNRWGNLCELGVPPQQGRRRWTHAELSELKRLLTAGVPWPEISSSLQRSTNACKNRLWYIGLANATELQTKTRFPPNQDET